MNQLISNQFTSPDLEQEAEVARSKLTLLREEADDLDAEAKRLARAFELEPTEETFAKKSVFEQRAKNAHEAASAFERDTLNPKQNAAKRAERDAIGRWLNEQEAAALKRFERAAELIAAGLRELDGAVNDLGALHKPRAEAAQKGVGIAGIKLSQIVENLLPAFRHLQGDGASYHTESVAIRFHDTGNAGVINLQVLRPVRINHSLR